MIDEKILKELKETNRILSSIRSFTIAQCQLTKKNNSEISELKREIHIAIKSKKKSIFSKFIKIFRREK